LEFGRPSYKKNVSDFHHFVHVKLLPPNSLRNHVGLQHGRQLALDPEAGLELIQGYGDGATTAWH
jgi:hypothetical protein